MIRGDIAASAAGLALRLLIRGCGSDVCFYASPRLRQHVATNPSKHGGRAKRFASRHKAPDTRRGRCRLCGRDQSDGGWRKQGWRRDRQLAVDDDAVSHC